MITSKCLAKMGIRGKGDLPMEMEKLVEQHEAIIGAKHGSIEWHERLKHVLEAYQYRHEELNKIDEFVKKTDEEMHFWISPGTISDRYIQLIQQFKRFATRHLITVKQFRDETVIWMKAMELTADMTSNASSHSEKNARLRGMIELIQDYIQRAMRADFDFGHSYYWWPDNGLFRSDYPTRKLMERIHQLEDEVKQLKGESSEVSEDAVF